MFLLANRAQVVDEKKAAELAGYLGTTQKSAFSFREYINAQHTDLEEIDNSLKTRIKILYLRCGHKCTQLSNHRYFNNFITTIIILASALVGIQTYPAMEYVPGRAANTGISRVWAIMDQIVLYIFTLEVVIKVVAEGLAPWRYFGAYASSADEDDDIFADSDLGGSHLGQESETSRSNKPSLSPEALGEIWVMASKQSIQMTHQQRAAFKTSGIRDPDRFLRTINRRADKTREPFSITKIKLDFWNVFDFVVVVVCYLPLGANMVAVIRLFRLLRVLKLVKALPELQVLVAGLLTSMTAIFYVGLLLLLVFYLYAVLCVTMLRENDPVHWENLQIAYLTLFRMATLEDWIDIVYTAILGCDVYNYGFREDECKNPKKLGWIAAPLFVSFVVVATFVVLNLFIGVINENMGLAKEQLEEMKKREEIRKMEAQNSKDSGSQDLTDLHNLQKRIKLLKKRAARLHQAFGMVQYDMKTLVEKMSLRSGRYEVNAIGAMEERPPKLFRKRSKKAKPQEKQHEQPMMQPIQEDGSFDDDAESDPVLPYIDPHSCTQA